MEKAGLENAGTSCVWVAKHNVINVRVFLKAVCHSMGAHSSCDPYAEPTDSDSDSPDDEAGADAGAATVNATAANATDDCEVCLVVQREPRLALVPCVHQRFCESCIRHLESIGSRCLICRADITMVLRLF